MIADDSAPPRIDVAPGHVEFPHVSVGDETTEVVEIRNLGEGTLEIDTDDIEVVEEDDHFSIHAVVDADDYVIDDNVLLEADGDDLAQVIIAFHPQDLAASTGAVDIATNDPEQPVETVDLFGNTIAPCLEIGGDDPMDFGSVSVDAIAARTVTLQNCSTSEPVDIESIRLLDDASGAFSLSDENADIDTLEPGQLVSVGVDYEHDDVGVYEGLLEIVGDVPGQSTHHIDLFAETVQAECATFEAEGAVDGAPFDNPVEATNQDVVELTSEIIDDAGYDDFSYEWTVIERPVGSTSTVAEPDAAETQFHVDILGSYALELRVVDENGVAACGPAVVTINARTDADVHIQLTWEAPFVEKSGGPDSSPDANRGTDLGLHYVRPDGQWGDPDSIYYAQRSADWTGDGQYNVFLDIDNLYGEEPENISHYDPQSGSHAIGVHYYCDNGWGPTDARVRVFVAGQLVAAHPRRLYQSDNFWYVGDLDGGDDPEFQLQGQHAEKHDLASCAAIGG